VSRTAGPPVPSWPSIAQPLLRRAVRTAKFVFTPLALACLALFAWQASDLLAATVRGAEPARLGLAVGLWLAAQTASPLVAAAVLRAFGAPIGYRRALGVHARRLPAKYLPGGVWHTVARGVDYHGLGVPQRAIAGFVIVEHGLAVAVALIAGGALLSLSPEGTRTPALLALLGGAALLGAGHLLLRRRLAHGSLGACWLAAAAGLLFWLIAAAAFCAYVAAFAGLAGEVGLVRIAGTYLVAWAAGFVAVFAPQGLGVFELVAGLMLPAPVGLATGVTLLAGFRVVILVADLLAWLLLRRV